MPADPVATARAELLAAEAERLEAEAQIAQTLADDAAKRARETRTAPAPGRR